MPTEVEKLLAVLQADPALPPLDGQESERPPANPKPKRRGKKSGVFVIDPRKLKNPPRDG